MCSKTLVHVPFTFMEVQGKKRSLGLPRSRLFFQCFLFFVLLWTCRNAFHSCLSASLVLAWSNRFGPPCVVTLPAILPVHSDKWPPDVCASLSAFRCACVCECVCECECVCGKVHFPFRHHHKLTFSDFKSLLKVKLSCARIQRFPFRLVEGLIKCFMLVCLHFNILYVFSPQNITVYNVHKSVNPVDYNLIYEC